MSARDTKIELSRRDVDVEHTHYSLLFTLPYPLSLPLLPLPSLVQSDVLVCEPTMRKGGSGDDSRLVCKASVCVCVWLHVRASAYGFSFFSFTLVFRGIPTCALCFWLKRNRDSMGGLCARLCSRCRSRSLPPLQTHPHPHPHHSRHLAGDSKEEGAG